MKKTMLAAAILFVAMIFQSCHKINGVGPVVAKTYNLTNFTSIDAGIDAEVYYTQDNFYKVEIEAQQNVLDIIQTPIVNGELRLEFEKYKNIHRHDRITVHITSPNINGLGINGSGTLRATQPINSSSLALKVNGSGSVNILTFNGESCSANISGSGRITVSGGAVNNEALRIAGSGDMDFMGLSAKVVTAEISGSGNGTVSVSDRLNVRISGSGSIYYYGNPSVQTEISGSGKVKHM